MKIQYNSSCNDCEERTLEIRQNRVYISNKHSGWGIKARYDLTKEEAVKVINELRKFTKAE